MKIFSNFDTKFREKVLLKRKEKFQDDQILIIRRSKYYFVFRVFIPFCILIWFAAAVYVFLWENNIINIIFYPLVLVWCLVVWFRTGHKLLKYLYDFTIVDPQWVTTYKQKWILHCSLKQIPANRIRSIEIKRTNIFENVFSYGKVNILTDFMENMHIWEDSESPSVIWMTYVDDPYKVKIAVTDICYK